MCGKDLKGIGQGTQIDTPRCMEATSRCGATPTLNTTCACTSMHVEAGKVYKALGLGV